MLILRDLIISDRYPTVEMISYDLNVNYHRFCEIMRALISRVFKTTNEYDFRLFYKTKTKKDTKKSRIHDDIPGFVRK